MTSKIVISDVGNIFDFWEPKSEHTYLVRVRNNLFVSPAYYVGGRWLFHDVKQNQWYCKDGADEIILLEITK